MASAVPAPFDGNTWRAVYTVQMRDAAYALHAFQKRGRTKENATKSRT
jgi:phage-related protein